MSGLDLKAIHEALAAQIRNGIDRSAGFTVKAFPSESSRPAIEVWPDGNYVTYFGTFGASGISEVNLVVRVLLSGANRETEWKTACDLLSAGTGHSSSIVDAVIADMTLGSAVASAFIGDAQWNPEDGAVDFPVRVVLNKQGAVA